MKIIPANIELSNQEFHALITAYYICRNIAEDTADHECFEDEHFQADTTADCLSSLLGAIGIEIEDE